MIECYELDLDVLNLMVVAHLSMVQEVVYLVCRSVDHIVDLAFLHQENYHSLAFLQVVVHPIVIFAREHHLEDQLEHPVEHPLEHPLEHHLYERSEVMVSDCHQSNWNN